MHQIASLDYLFRGRANDARAEDPELFLAVEISVKVDVRDVQRAFDRANILRRCGLRADAVVGGQTITLEAKERCDALGVAFVVDRGESD